MLDAEMVPLKNVRALPCRAGLAFSGAAAWGG